MAIETLYPAIRPSLDLNFAGSKTLDPRITFTRASAATYYDGKTVAKAEENLLTYSQQITAGVGAWAGQGLATSTTVNSAQAPDATVTASTINVTSGAGGVRYYSTIPAGTYTVSVYIRSVSGSTDFAIDFENLYSTSFTLSSVWQRVTATVTFAVTRTWIDFQISAPGIFEIWGAQLEQRGQVTAYTPTTTQPITNYIPVLQTAPAGVPRFDHNPVTGESLGLLVEEQRTNVLLRSEEFSNSSWGKVGSSIFANVISAPDGSLTVDKLVENSASGVTHGIDQSITTTAAAYTFSAYVKPAERSRLRFASAIGLAPAASFDLLAVTATPLGSTTSATITPVGNGWFRCTATRTLSAGSDVAQIQLLNNSGLEAYTGDGYSGIYIWGAQLEAGAFPTSYIKTEASQVTRAADSASMVGANFSSWYRQDEGTMFADAKATGFDGARAVFEIGDGTNSNRLNLQRTGTQFEAGFATVVSGNTVAYLAIQQVFKPDSSAKLSASYANNNFAYSCNGSVPLVDTFGVIPVSTLARIGSAITGTTAIWCGHIKRLTYYPKALPGNLHAITA